MNRVTKLANDFASACAPLLSAHLSEEDKGHIRVLSRSVNHTRFGVKMLEQDDAQFGMRDEDPESFDFMMGDYQAEDQLSSLLIADIFARTAERAQMSDRAADFVPVSNTLAQDISFLNDQGMEFFASVVKKARDKARLP